MAPQSPRVPSDLELARERAAMRGQPTYDERRASYLRTLEAAIERRNRQRLQEEQSRQQQGNARRDAATDATTAKRQQQYAAANMAQQAAIAADRDAADARYRQQLALQQQQADMRQQQFDAKSQRQGQLLDIQAQTDRDKRQYAADLEQARQQAELQAYRDVMQQQNTLERDAFQQQNLLQRDATQFGMDVLRADQSQQNTMQRDYMQGALQAERDARLNQYDVQQRQDLAVQQQQRDNAAFLQSRIRDREQQKFAAQSQFEQEAADIAAKWQAQVQQRKDAGLEFSASQQAQMQQMEQAFLENVVNADLPDDIKARANVQYQRRLSAIVPLEKVVTPEQEIAAQFYEHPKYGLLQKTVGSNGMPQWDIVGTMGPGSGQEAAVARQQQATEKAAAAQQKALNDARLQRLQAFEQELKTRATEVTDPLTMTPKYPQTTEGQQRLLRDAARAFAPKERYYQQHIGLEPLALEDYQQAIGSPPPPPAATAPQARPTDAYRAQAQQQAAAAALQQSAPPAQSRSAVPAATKAPAATAAPTATLRPAEQQLSQQMAMASQKNDTDALGALTRIAELSAGGPPKLGSQEMKEMMMLQEMLREAGYALEPPPLKSTRGTARPKAPSQQSWRYDTAY